MGITSFATFSDGAATAPKNAFRAYAKKLARLQQKLAKGTSEQHGRNVRANSSLNKSILDQGWGEFHRQLSYKLSWLGGKTRRSSSPVHKPNL